MGKSLNGKELGKGISQRKDGLYQARFINRFGKRETIYAKTYTDITRKLREAQFNDEKQMNVINDNVTLDEWFDIWISVFKKNCRNTTIESYGIRYNRIKEELGWRKLNSLNLTILQKAFNNLKTDIARRYTKKILVDMLNCAVKTDLLSKNVAVDIKVDLDNTPKKEKVFLTEEQQRIVLEYAKKSGVCYLYPFLAIGLETGMRAGEICGLTWDCIDFDKNTIRVEKTYCRVVNRDKRVIYEFHPPKSEASRRIIPMTVKVKNIFIELSHSDIPPTEGQFKDVVLLKRNGDPVFDKNVNSVIKTLVKKINHDGIEFPCFTPHCLRHTFATECIARGMKPKALQKILGHSNLRMTMDLYCHVTDETLKSEMSVIGAMA